MWDELKNGLIHFGNGFVQFALVLVIGAAAVKLLLIPIKKALHNSKGEHTAKTFVFSIVRVVLYGVVVIAALGTAGINVSSLLATFGIAAMTAGLAFQDTLKNFVSGMIILFTKPFAAGDLVVVNGFEGYVDSIRLFYTQIHTFDNRIVQIPNFKLTDSSVVNASAAGTRRVDMKFCVGYEESLAEVKSVIYRVLSDNPLVLNQPEAKVYVSQHLDSGVEITVFAWTDQENYYSVLFRTQEDVKNAFDENGITIPYPHVEVMKSQQNKKGINH